MNALPTIPRWPATKILSDFFTCTVVSSQKLSGRQDACQPFGLAEISASILNAERMRFILWFAALGLASACLAQTSPAPKAPVDQLIPWLLNEDQQLRGVPFSELIFDTTGRKVLSFEANDAVDQRVAKAITAARDETMKILNASDSVIQNVERINEVSSHFEDTLRELLSATP